MAVDGNRIRLLRKQAGLTQEELGKKMGVIKQTVSSWENNISEPNSEILLSMASVFDVSVDYLLGNDTPENPSKKNINTNKPNNTLEENFFNSFFGEKNAMRDVFAKRVKTAILDIGLTDEDFKNGISFGRERANSFLDGSGEPTANDLIELSQFLDTSIDYLLGQIPRIGNVEKKLLNAFISLDTDNQDIIIGKTKELLKEQRYESVAADPMPLKKTGTDNPKK